MLVTVVTTLQEPTEDVISLVVDPAVAAEALQETQVAKAEQYIQQPAEIAAATVLLVKMLQR